MVLLRVIVTLTALLLLSGVPAGAATDPVGQWPLRPQPEVVAGFDPPDSPWGAGHRGVDLLGSPGQAVHAALAGTITFAGQLAGRGVVVIDHGDTRTTYEPVLDSLARGTPVVAGETIGRLGTVGSHCWPRSCLHWGWLRGDTYLDPLRLVGGGPVRLLPLAGLAGDQPTTALARWRAPPLPYADWRPQPGSGAGVGLLVGPAEPVGRHVGVELGGRQ